MQKFLFQIILTLSFLQPLYLFASVPAPIDNSSLLNLDLRVFLAARPITIILVEKDQQRLRVLKHDGRLHVIAEYTAVTGEKDGRKVVEGDEKTPEGVYFITKKYIDTKVSVFGTRAFHLNYPNVFDVRDGRGGNGIFIHGTNKPLRRNSTNGCITLNNRDLDDLADYLNIGRIPVIIVDSLRQGQEELNFNQLTPNLAEADFAVVKQVLLPDYAPRDAEFVSIYTLRANNQVVIAGEYKGLGGSLRSYAAGYYDTHGGVDLAVLERIPAAKGVLEDLSTITISTVASTSPALEDSSDSALFEFGQIWQPKHEDVYLSWYRDSLRANPQVQAAIAQQPVSGPEGLPEKLVYGLFILASCVSIGSALFFIRFQLRRAEKGAVADEHGHSAVLQKGINAAPLRKDLQKVKETLQLMQDHVQKEASRMDSEVQARIEDLENGLAAKKAEIEQLSAEKAALKLKSMSHMSGQIQELTQIKQELQATEDKLDEAREDLAKLPVLEEMLASQKEDMQQLAIEKATMSMELREGAAGQESEIDALRGQVTAESQKTNELNKELEVLQLSLQNTRQELQVATEGKSTLVEQVSQIDGLEDELRRSRAQMEKLSFDNELLKEEIDSSDSDAKLESMQRKLAEAHDDLHISQSRNAHLSQQLNDRERLQQELNEKRAEIEQLALDNGKLAVAADTSDIEGQLFRAQEKLSISRDELSRQESVSRDLEDQLQAKELLEKELTERSTSLERMVDENKRLKEAVEQSELQAELAEVQSELATANAELQVANQQELQAATEKSNLAEQVSQIEVLDDELRRSKAEIEQLTLENGKLAVAVDTSDIEGQLFRAQEKLSMSRDELSRQESVSRDLEDQLQAKDSLEKELTERSTALERMVDENKRLEEAVEQSELQAELAKVQSESATANAELQVANEQNAGLVETNARFQELEELMLARQVEVTSLKNELVAQKKMANDELDASRKELSCQIDEIKKELRLAQEAGEVVSSPVVDEPSAVAVPEEVEVVDLKDDELEAVDPEVTKQVEKVVDSDEPSPTTITSASLTHGTKFLPGDILDKWMTG